MEEEENQSQAGKLKIPKVEEEAILKEEEDWISIPNQTPRVCPKCYKEFSSGKSLGGHMKIHAYLKPTIFKKQEIIDLNNKKMDINPETKPICLLCDKKFPSKKSLCGHMRCHPGRKWRGIHPPPTSPSSSLVSDALPPKIKQHEIDLTQCLPRWSVTDRRGRKAVIPPPSSVDEDEHDAVRNLMMLSHLDSSSRCSGLIQHKQTIEETNSNSLTNKAEIEDSIRVSGSTDSAKVWKSATMNHLVDKGKEKTVSHHQDHKYYCSDDDELESRNTVMSKKEKTTKKMKLVTDLESVQNASPDKYKCSTCNKCFPSHQALGGHKSSHNKFKITIINTIDDHESASENPMIKTKQKVQEVTHQCKICDKTFLTGQALGGHKRCHWSTPLSPPPQDAPTTIRKILDFDLNELPPMEN